MEQENQQAWTIWCWYLLNGVFCVLITILVDRWVNIFAIYSNIYYISYHNSIPTNNQTNKEKHTQCLKVYYNRPFMLSWQHWPFLYYDASFLSNDIHASNNLTDSGRRNYYYDLRMSYSIRSVDRKYVFVFYKMSVITYLLIVSQLIL